ncbi:sulfite exporter TauE/SafE family protein [Salipiger sp. PrR002]|uniref:sulfite exporter TauE/SafE family protein n=1 Tax=Salipiger sp. PrR002 TaxID=2706489 RepID=UPI0013BD333C|nr:sulfite exporter TauE/SafE family protein [Salipiger sp. PrR002]NDW01232.1 sulfite exporter TauE/SafE family protein [Salipiger sp. PrR002]NDW58124.1 sulfite exporter TauE/SafE family protein [Salipiger sp. PrR004]
MEYLILFAVIAAAGAVAGIISGLLGVGGGIILVPAFYYVFTGLGYEPNQLMQICVATSTGTIIVTSLRSVTSHHKRGAVSVELIKTWGPFIAIGSVLGVLAATVLRSHQLQLVFGIVGVCLGLYMLLGKKSWRLSDTLPGRGLSAIYGGIIGFFSALMGIGGGSFTVPLLTAYNVPPHRAVGTSPGFGLLISIPGFIAFLLTGWEITGKPPGTVGYVNLPAVLLIMVTSLLTVPTGVKLAHSLSPARLRLVFALTVLVLAGNMLRKALMG